MFLPNQIDAFALFSEGAAYNRIFVARAARRLPGILEARIRRGASGRSPHPRAAPYGGEPRRVAGGGSGQVQARDRRDRRAPCAEASRSGLDPEASATYCREGGTWLGDGTEVIPTGRSSPRCRASLRRDVRIQVHRIARGPRKGAQGAGPSPPSPPQRRSRGRLRKSARRTHRQSDEGPVRGWQEAERTGRSNLLGIA